MEQTAQPLEARLQALEQRIRSFYDTHAGARDNARLLALSARHQQIRSAIADAVARGDTWDAAAEGFERDLNGLDMAITQALSELHDPAAKPD
jgi:hypothetical protein